MRWKKQLMNNSHDLKPNLPAFKCQSVKHVNSTATPPRCLCWRYKRKGYNSKFSSVGSRKTFLEVFPHKTIKFGKIATLLRSKCCISVNYNEQLKMSRVCRISPQLQIIAFPVARLPQLNYSQFILAQLLSSL